MVAEMGRKGGIASAKALTPEQRKARARKAVAARWAKRTAPDDGHVIATVVGTTSESPAELARRICQALKSERISRAVRAAKAKRPSPR